MSNDAGFLIGRRCRAPETVNPGDSDTELGKRGARIRQAIKLDIGGDQDPVGRVPIGIEGNRSLGQIQGLVRPAAEEMGKPGNGQKHEEAGIQRAERHGPLGMDQRVFRIAAKSQRGARQ